MASKSFASLRLRPIHARAAFARPHRVTPSSNQVTYLESQLISLDLRTLRTDTETLSVRSTVSIGVGRNDRARSRPVPTALVALMPRKSFTTPIGTPTRSITFTILPRST